MYATMGLQHHADLTAVLGKGLHMHRDFQHAAEAADRHCSCLDSLHALIFKTFQAAPNTLST